MKKNNKFLLVFLALGLLLACARTPQQLISEKPILPTVDLTSKNIRDAIVLIEREKQSGTGFFVAPDLIATNIHSVAHSGPVSVKSSDKGKNWTIEGVVGFDAKNGLVILKLTDEGKPLPLADGGQIGESVSILSYPDGAFKILESSIQSIRKSNRWFKLNRTLSKKTNGSPVFNNKDQVIGLIVPYGSYAVSSSALEALLDKSMPIEPLAEWQQREQIRAAAYYSLGKEKVDAKDYAGAIVDFDKAIEFNPAYIYAYYGRSKAQAYLGDHDSAIAACTQVLEMAPDEAGAYYARGSVKAHLGDYTTAIVDFGKAIELDPQYANAYSNRGFVGFKLGESESAHGNTKEAQRLYEAAIADCDKAIKIDPEYAYAYNVRGAAKLSLDDFEGAIFDFDRSIEIDPEDADVYSNRARVKCKLGDIESTRGEREKAHGLYSEGITDFDKYIQLNDPKDADVEIANLESKNARDATVRVMSWSGSFRSGSGFFIDKDKIVTNVHVVAQPGPVFATLSHKAEIWAVEGVTAFDVENDLVILKLAGEGTPLALGSSETVQSGESVTAVGYTDQKYKITKGTMHSILNSSKWLRVKIDIDSGGSGSPILNSGGEVIGIHAAGNNTYSYAIPSSVLKALLAQWEAIEPLAEWQKRELIRAYALFVQGQTKHEANQYHDAIADYDKAIQINPQFFYAYFKRGDAKSDLGNYAAAIADYDKAIKIDDMLFNIYFDRGLAQSELADNEAAIADYDKAIEINPEDAKLYSRRGVAKLRLRYFEEAILDFNRAIEINPQPADAYKKRAHAKFKLGESKTAQGNITRALQLYQSAMEDCTQLIQLTPKDADAYDNRGWARFHLGESETARGNIKKAADLYEKAIEDYTHAIWLNPEHPYAYRNRAKAKFRLHNYEEAIIDLDKAIQINPKNAKYYYDRGVAKEALGQKEAAKADFQKAKALDPDVGK